MLNSAKINRLLHKYLGIFGLLFFIIFSVSGIALMHPDTFHLKDKMIGQKFIPDKYFEIQQPNNINIRSISVSRKNWEKVLLGTNVGVFKTSDGGKNWSESNQGLYNLNVSVIKHDFLDEQILYAGTETGIFKSTNGGESWDEWFEETTGLELTNITDIAIDPSNSNKIFAAAQNEIYLSEDGGESWEKIFEDVPLKNGGGISSLYIFSENPNAIFAATSSGLFKTNDGGRNWERIQKEILDRPILSIFSSSRNSNYIFAGTDSGLIQTINKGKTWNLSLQNKPIRLIADYPGRENELILSTGNELLKSSNNGQSWESIFKNNDKDLLINEVNFSDPSKGNIIVGTNKGLFSIDVKNNWEHITLNMSKVDNQAEPKEMNLLKLITEIHTGRFFGNYFYLVFDIASVFLIITSISGLFIYVIRYNIRKRQKGEIETLDKIDLIMDFNEKTQEISKDSKNIHDLAEHLKGHVKACMLLVQNGNLNEIQKVEAHINAIDKKLHHLLTHVQETEDLQV